MTTVYDVPAEPLIRKVADSLKADGKVTPPDWAPLVKTGIHKEKPPVEEDWWYIRVASVLRKVYMNGPIGSSRLKAMFGGKVDKGSKPYKAGAGSGAIARLSLKQLEGAGLLVKHKEGGRMITPAGQKLMDKAAAELKAELVKEMPALSKY